MISFFLIANKRMAFSSHWSFGWYGCILFVETSLILKLQCKAEIFHTYMSAVLHFNELSIFVWVCLLKVSNRKPSPVPPPSCEGWRSPPFTTFASTFCVNDMSSDRRSCLKDGVEKARLKQHQLYEVRSRRAKYECCIQPGTSRLKNR